MSITRKFSSVFLLLLAASACDAGEPESEVTTNLRASAQELEDAGCPAYRQIARLAQGQDSCPDVDGWTATPLFAGATGELKEFCKYQWDGPLGQVDVEILQGDTGLSAVASDCEVVFEQGDALWDAVGGDVEALFHQAIGRATATDLDLLNSESSRWRVAVAVVDSVPEPAPAYPRSEHGERMVSLINDIACPSETGSCDVSIVRSLGLPRYGAGYLDTQNGGEYGSQADIAEAIHEAVKTWKAADWGAEPARLIINMSVAWEGDLFGDMSDPTPRPSVDAVHSAIEYAVCHGAIVIAAAGNQGHLCTTGALLPGAWEQHPAPDLSRCTELGAPPAPGGIGYKPLLYSVGGLTHDQQRMDGTRIGGMPRLAAAATHAIAGGDSTALTGTSVASAVAAGTAALVWSYVPGLTPSAVMSVIYQSGDPLTQTADYIGPNTSSNAVRAVDVCRAIHVACQLPNVSCPAMPLACLNATAPVTMDDLFDEVAALTPDHDVSPTWAAKVECPNECDPSTNEYLESGEQCDRLASGRLAQDLVGVVSSPCPAPINQTLPFTLPQPTQIGCSNCTIDVPTSTVDTSLDENYTGAIVEDVNVAVFDGARTTYFRFGPLPINPLEITRLRLDPTLMPAYVESATISLTLSTEPRPIVDPLLIGR